MPALTYLPLAIPFGILTVVGGINVTESARVAGDDHTTRDILLTEAVATLVAGVCGGVAQSTPSIGHPAYKRMGARAGYTLMAGAVIGLGGIFGFVSYVVELIPRAVLPPILIFLAMDIMAQAFRACPARHASAVAFAFFPTVARLLAIKLSNPEAVLPETFQRLLTLPAKALPETLVIVALGHRGARERFHHNGHALGRVSCAADRSPAEDLGALSGDPRGTVVLRRHPFRLARRPHVLPVDAERACPEGSLSVRPGIPRPGRPAARPLVDFDAP